MLIVVTKTGSFVLQDLWYFFYFMNSTVIFKGFVMGKTFEIMEIIDN